MFWLGSRGVGGFDSHLHTKVVTMGSMKKGIKIQDKTMYDIEKLYGRLLVVSQTCDVSLAKMLCFELALLLCAFFDDYGFLRKSSSPNCCINLPYSVRTTVNQV